MLISVSIALMLAMQSAASPSEARQADDNKIICKSEAKTGTRNKTRTCYTKAQWDKIREQNQRDVRELIDRPQIETQRGG